MIVYAETNFLRSGPFSTVTESSRDLLKALVASGEDTQIRLEDTIAALVSIAGILPLDSGIVARDSKGFANPDVYDDLDRLGCKLIVSFENGLGFIRNELKLGGG